MAEGIDILSPVTTAGGLYPALHTMIVQTAMPKMVARQFFQQYSLTGATTNSISFAKQAGSTSVVYNRTEEGQLIPLDMTPYTFTNVVPYKVGSGYLITRELIEDSMLPVVQDQLTRKALIMGNTVDKDCVTALIDNALAANTVTGTGTSMYYDGTATTLATTLGTYDITDAIKNVKKYNYEPNILFINPTIEGQIRRLPHFTATNWFGDKVLMHGEIGTILGLRVVVSSNCVNSTNNVAFVISTGLTANVQQQYSPLGYFVEKRPLSTQVKEIPERDSQAVYMTMRYSPVVLKSESYAMINTLGTF